MRVRTEAKREAILDAAADVFMELGFDRASMSEIATRFGGSKATVYGYFESKEDLFSAVMHRTAGYRVQLALTEMTAMTRNEPRAVLSQLGEHLLMAILKPQAMAVRRMVIAESAQSDVGQRFWTMGPQPAFDAIAAYLTAATQAGRLKVKNQQVATQQMMALFNAELEWRWLFGVQEKFARAHVRQAVAHAVDVFLAYYGVNEGGAKKPGRGRKVS